MATRWPPSLVSESVNIASFKVAHKLVTGSGSIKRLRDEVERLKFQKPLIVTDSILQKAGAVGQVADELGSIDFGIYAGVQPEPEIQWPLGA